MEEGGLEVRQGGGWRMTGSALQRWTLQWRVFSVAKGRGLEEGGLQVEPDGRDADFRFSLEAHFDLHSSSLLLLSVES